MDRSRKYSVVVIAVLLVSAPWGEPLWADAIPDEPTRLRVTTVNSLSHAPLFIADEKGFFADECLEVEGVTFRRTTQALPGLAAGDIDVYVGVISPSLFNVMSRTDDVKIVLARGRLRSEGCSAYSIMARRELVDSGKLTGLEDLKGLRVGTERTSSNYYIINMLLESAGLTPDDVETVYVPFRLRPEGFQRNIIDVSTASEPWQTRILTTGSAVKWMPGSQIVPGFQHGFILFGPSLLEKNREAGRRFVTAYLRAVRQYNREGKTDRHLEIVAEHLRVDVDFLRQTCWPYHENDGRLDFESIDRYQTWAFGEGLIDRALTKDELWDHSFVDYANGVLDEPE